MMFKRKIKLFGRSIPVAMVLAVVTVVGTLAAFIWSQLITGTFSARVGPDLSAGTWSCSLVGNGIEDECTSHSNGARVTYSELDNDSVVTASTNLTKNAPAGDACLSLNTGAVPAEVQVSGVLEDLAGTKHDLPLTWNTVLGAGPYYFEIIYEYPGLASGQTLPVFDVGLEFAEGACP